MQKRTPISSYVIPLPIDFADRVLKLEISVEVENSMESLRSLLELYSQAIEFYESIRDPKFKYYQDRMMDVLQKQNNSLLADSQEPPVRNSVSVSHDLLQQRQADRTIKLHEEASQNLSRQVSMNIHDQNNSIPNRVSTRKSRNISADHKNPRKIPKSLYKIENFHKRRSSEGESDKSGGVSLTKEAEEFEKELEQIMEQSVMEKIEKTQKIKKKYREQIEDIKKMKGNAIMDQLIQELQRAMQQELSELESALEDKRKIAIKKIREFLVTR